MRFKYNTKLRINFHLCHFDLFGHKDIRDKQHDQFLQQLIIYLIGKGV